MSTDHRKESDLVTQVEKLYGEGKGRNEIARALHTTTYRVDQAAKQAGIVFDGTTTEQAVKARVAIATLERQALAARFRSAANDALCEITDSTLPIEHRRSAAILAGICVDKDLVLHDRTSKDEQQDLLNQLINSTLGVNNLDYSNLEGLSLPETPDPPERPPDEQPAPGTAAFLDLFPNPHGGQTDD